MSAEASPNSASGLQAQSALSGDPIRKVDAPLLPHRTVVVVVKPLDLSALAPGAFGDWDQVSNAIPATLPR